MKAPTVAFSSVLAFLFSVTSAHALIVPYGPRQIEEAGVGCVGGLNSAHNNTAFFRGDTERLNEQLASLARDAQRYRSIKVVLHAGTKSVAPAEDTPARTGLGDQERDQQIPIDWSICKLCVYEKVVTGLCKHDEKSVTVDVWIGATIRLEELSIPSKFTVQSAGELEDFAKRHAAAK